MPVNRIWAEKYYDRIGQVAGKNPFDPHLKVLNIAFSIYVQSGFKRRNFLIFWLDGVPWNSNTFDLAHNQSRQLSLLLYTSQLSPLLIPTLVILILRKSPYIFRLPPTTNVSHCRLLLSIDCCHWHWQFGVWANINNSMNHIVCVYNCICRVMLNISLSAKWYYLFYLSELLATCNMRFPSDECKLDVICAC